MAGIAASIVGIADWFGERSQPFQRDQQVEYLGILLVPEIRDPGALRSQIKTLHAHLAGLSVVEKPMLLKFIVG